MTSTTTSTFITYADGGYDDTQPENNAVLIVQRDFDADGVQVGSDRIVFQAPGYDDEQ